MKKQCSCNPSYEKCLKAFDLVGVARECGWLQRLGSKLDAHVWVQAFLAASAIPCASLRTVAFYGGIFISATVSKQALHKRLHNKGTALIEAILSASIQSKSQVSDKGLGCLGFKRILLQDSTSIKLPSRLRETYQGPGNEHGRSANVKVQAVFDLLGSAFLKLKVGNYAQTDSKAAEDTSSLVGSKDLLCWDLGYFNLSAFGDILARGADILTRARAGAVILDAASGDRIDLLAMLRGRGEADMSVLVGEKKRLPMRLVAYKLPKKIADERRRKAKEGAKRRGQQIKKATLDLLDWGIYLTSCSCDQLPVEKVKELYAQRWNVEILFKSFKSHMRLAEVPSYACEEMALCLIYATLLRATLCHATLFNWARSKCGRSRVSHLKATSLFEALGAMLPTLQLDRDVLEANILKHCQYDKRKRLNIMQQLESLG